MTEAEATRVLSEESRRAEEDFFRDHWGKLRPRETEEILDYISATERPVRVSSIHRSVLTRRIDPS